MTRLAHAKWFLEDPEAHGADWSVVTAAPTLALIAATVALAAGAALGLRPVSPAPAPLDPLRRHVPRLLACCAGLSLVLLAARGRFLSPTVGVDGTALPAVALVVGLWLAAGPWRRGAGVALGGLLVVMAAVGGPVVLAESAVLAGVAVCLALPHGRSGAVALRVALGASLVTAAFTEKLAAPGLTEAVLQAHPPLDVLADPAFVRPAGAAELLIGLMLISGAATQLVALAALAPFAASVAVFGMPELVGHLPIYGSLAALAILASRAPAAVPDRRVADVRRRAVIATLPSDAHTWNLVYLELLLVEHGYDVVNLGPCTPADLVVRSCREHRADLLVVSTVNGHGHADANELIAAVRRDVALAELRVVIGGKLDVHGGRSAEMTPRLVRAGYDAVFPDAAGIPAFVAFLDRAPEPALAA